MAYRIHDSVLRGEIDNRTKGTVLGRIWLHGREAPLILDLKGNAWPDLAGSLLTFTNLKPNPCPREIEGLVSLQIGSAGDLTASRKVRAYTIPVEEVYEMARRAEKPPERLTNSLYLEWFSKTNGRVVIESVDYQLSISAPEWRLTPEEEAHRAQQAAAGLSEFMGRLTKAIEKHQPPDPEEEPWDEFDYEEILKQSDARTDKHMELLDKYGHSEEAQEKINDEMGWNEQVSDDDAEQEAAAADDWVDALNAACEDSGPEPEPDPSLEGIDWIRTEDGDLSHPLQYRAFEAGMKFVHATAALGLKIHADKDLEAFVFGFQMTGAKLAGALNSIARGYALPDPAFTVACLKRALDNLHKSQAGLEASAARKLLPETLIGEARKELFEIREETLRLMNHYRGQRR